MKKSQAVVAVLWGAGCEEVVAAIFITELRRANLTVKLIGLGGRQARGRYGLGLLPDLRINQALPLTQQIACIVIPCASESFERFLNDPYLVDFLQTAHQNQVLFVVASQDVGVWGASAICYPLDGLLFAFVQNLATQLGG